MIDLRALYQETITDHGRNPRHFHVLEHANDQAEGFNPLCGDRIHIYVLLQNSLIQKASFQGTGCAISIASASLMLEELIGNSIEIATEKILKFQTFLTQKNKPEFDLGKLNVFQGVRDYPVRIKCATLAWHTLRAVLKKEKTMVSTE